MATIIPRVSFSGQSLPKRQMRRPKHPFSVRHMPYMLCPFFIAPVLPGETMKMLTLQSRGVSKTMKSFLTGAWLEHYFFYVKFSDMDAFTGVDDSLKDMIINPGRVMTDIDSTALNYPLGTKAVTTPGGDATQIPYITFCLAAVLTHYFRDQDEAWNLAAGVVSNGTFNEYLTHLQPGKNFLDSAIQDVEWTSKDIDVDLDSDDTITAQEVQTAMGQWEILKQGRLTDMTFEQYLVQQGVNSGLAGSEEHRPELIRMIRDWSYPVNTVDPTDGDPSTAFSWAVTESADKDRFFSEPGFLFGVTCFRPKAYMGSQSASMSCFMNDVHTWLPNAALNHPATSMKKFNGSTTNSPNESDGPFDAIVDDYWIDMRDYFLYGEQFVNYVKTAGDGSILAIPEADLARKYVLKAELDTLFQGATALDGFSQDGIVTLNILGQQVDSTPTTGQEDD